MTMPGETMEQLRSLLNSKVIQIHRRLATEEQLREGLRYVEELLRGLIGPRESTGPPPF